MNQYLALPLCFCLLLPSGCSRAPIAAPSDTGRASLTDLLQGMRQRLELMHPVARVKWNKQTPIFDPDRERVMLEGLVERGRRQQVDAGSTRTFFAAQMEAAKLVQEEDHRRWREERHAPFADVPDLATLRQEIDTINGRLLTALGPAHRFLTNDDGQRELAAQSVKLFADVPELVREAALRPLRQR